MFDILIIGILVLVILSLGFFYLMQTLIIPHKLDNIKALLETGKYDQAINILQTALKKNDKDPMVHLYLAEAYYLNNNYEMAVLEYKQAMVSGKFDNTVTEKVIRKRLADIYLKFGQLEEAQKEYLILSKQEPSNSEYLFQIGKIFFDRGMKEQALNYLDRALKNGKNNAQLFFLIGRIYYDMNKTGEALNAFTNAVKLEPKNYEAHFYIGLILKAMNSYGKAIEEFDITEQTKDNQLKVKAIYNKGLCKLETGDNDNAKADFERALKYSNEENNTTIAIRYTLGCVYEKERRLLEAVEQWEKVAQMRPNYQDVQLKLATYEDLRVDDKLKDLLTSTPTTFEIITQNLLRNMGYEVIETNHLDDDHLEIQAVERSTKWRNVRGGKVLVKISRDGEDVHEDEISKLIDQLKSIHGTRAIYITTGKFTNQALRYAENRPVDLYDRQKLTQLLKSHT